MTTPNLGLTLDPTLFWQILQNHPPTALIRQEIEQLQKSASPEETIQTVTNRLRINPDWLHELESAALTVHPGHLPSEQLHIIQQSLRLVHGVVVAKNTILEKLCTWANYRIEGSAAAFESEELYTESRILLTETLTSINWVKQLHLAYVN